MFRLLGINKNSKVIILKILKFRNGNVALDVARILSRKPEELALTDISSKAFKMIQNNRIENVVL